MTDKNKIDKIHDKLILQAKKLALVELQIKIKEDIEKLDTELNCIDSDEDEIPFQIIRWDSKSLNAGVMDHL